VKHITMGNGHAILNEYSGIVDANPVDDVKYHLGANCIRPAPSEKLALSLLANPSHLEAEDPLVLGVLPRVIYTPVLWVSCFTVIQPSRNRVSCTR
jgi:2-oxoglutarate dehydrogenase complex dehydrogenase (E1) component-like enzyme